MVSGNINRAALLVMLGLWAMAIPAYAGDAQKVSEQLPAAVYHVEVDKKSVAAVDYYGDGTLMVEVPATGHKKTATISEALDSLIPIPVEARSLTVEQTPDGRIFIKSASAANNPVPHPPTAARVKNSAEITESNGRNPLKNGARARRS
jgi:hypothetical protein